MSLVVQTVEDAGALEALGPAWEALWQRAPAATPFQSPHWLVPWWRAFHPGDLTTVAIWQGDRLVALAPLYREDGGDGPPFARRLLPIGISLSDYLDVLIDPAVPEAAEALATTLAGVRGGWEALDLEELAPDASALALPAPPDCEDTSAAQSACPVLTLGDDPERLGGAVPSGKLRKLRMARNRLSRRAGASLGTIGEDGAAAFLDDLIRLHGARWATKGEAGVLSDDAVRRFQGQALPRLIRSGLARCYRLAVEGQVVGAYYGFLSGPRAFAYLGGFDPAFAFESPGTVLVGHAIEEAVRAGCREFHFLRGQEAYKYEWGASDRWNRRRSLRRVPVHA